MRDWIRIFTLGCLLFGICPSTQTLSGDRASSQEPPPGPQEIVEFAGKVVYVPIEGGFWGLVDDQGAKYDPGTLPRSYRKEGLEVRVRAKVLQDVVTFRMWGRRVELLQIEPVTEHRSAPSDDVGPRH